MKNADEIKKALETEIHLAEYVDSDYCNNTEVALLKSVLDLINQYEAKIKSKQETIDMFTDIGKLYSEIKAEAYKECIEKCKEEWGDGEFVCAEDFDDLLTEMGIK